MSTTLKTQFLRQPISNNFNVLTLCPKVELMQLNRSPIQDERFQFQFNLFHYFRHEFISFLFLSQVPSSLEQYHFDVISIPSEAFQNKHPTRPTADNANKELDFKGQYTGENLSEQGKNQRQPQPTYGAISESNPGHIGGRRVLSPLHQLCSLH